MKKIDITLSIGWWRNILVFSLRYDLKYQITPWCSQTYFYIKWGEFRSFDGVQCNKNGITITIQCKMLKHLGLYMYYSFVQTIGKRQHMPLSLRNIKWSTRSASVSVSPWICPLYNTKYPYQISRFQITNSIHNQHLCNLCSSVPDNDSLDTAINVCHHCDLLVFCKLLQWLRQKFRYLFLQVPIPVPIQSLSPSAQAISK